MLRAFVIASILALAVATAIQAAAPQLINYQGRLTDASGDPVSDGSYSVSFRIWSAPAGGFIVWAETQSVNTTDGLFAVLLGSVNPILDIYFDETTRYLGIAVSGSPELSPRAKLVSVPFAFRATKADVADAADVSGTSGFSDSTDAITDGAVDMSDIGQAGASSGQVLKWNGSAWAPGTDDGGSASGWTDDGAVVRLITNTDSVGIGTSAPTEKLDVAGNIHASGTIASGASIVIDGINDRITASSGTIDFDNENLFTTGKATIGPGNTNTGTNAFVAGVNNTADDTSATVSGGRNNKARGIYSVVAGGGGAFAIDSNSASGNYSAIGGGRRNTASARESTVGGGNLNIASGLTSTISGGQLNIASGSNSAVGGGRNNSAIGMRSVVAGGENNVASNTWAVVPGGSGNTASGGHAFAAGSNASANHSNTFVWSDGAVFASTGNLQFLINARGGVGIGNNNPQAPLDIKPKPGFSDLLRFTMDRVWAFRQQGGGANTSLRIQSLTAGSGKHFIILPGGGVGIGATEPTAKLHVIGDICATGSIGACSDARYKRDVTTLSEGLANILRIRGVKYRWKQAEYPDQEFDGNTHIGFIAQELEETYPEIVRTDKNGFKSIDYGRLAPVLVEAIKEQQEQINELKSVVDKLVTTAQTNAALSKK